VIDYQKLIKIFGEIIVFWGNLRGAKFYAESLFLGRVGEI
jgi:hypothetical protein